MATNQHDTQFWRDIAIAHSQVAVNHDRQVTVTSDAESLVAVVMWDNQIDGVSITVFAKTGNELRKDVVTDATDRS